MALLAGVDEVGRGCLAGSVFAAAVVLASSEPWPGLTDSKKLSDKQRRALAAQIKARALAWSLGRAEASEIDRINILQASLLAMKRALASLPIGVDSVLVDGRHLPDLNCPARAVVGGDRLIVEISAASVLAKVARDDEMNFLDRLYPGYGFAEHKGYPTSLHQQKLQQLGICPQHRVSYAPVKKLL